MTSLTIHLLTNIFNVSKTVGPSKRSKVYSLCLLMVHCCLKSGTVLSRNRYVVISLWTLCPSTLPCSPSSVSKFIKGGSFQLALNILCPSGHFEAPLKKKRQILHTSHVLQRPALSGIHIPVDCTICPYKQLSQPYQTSSRGWSLSFLYTTQMCSIKKGCRRRIRTSRHLFAAVHSNDLIQFVQTSFVTVVFQVSCSDSRLPVMAIADLSHDRRYHILVFLREVGN